MNQSEVMRTYKSNVSKTIDIDDGAYVQLMQITSDVNGYKAIDITCNLYCFESDGEFRWRVNGIRPISRRSPIVGIRLDKSDNLIAHSFHGHEYIVDKNNGKVKNHRFIR